MEIGKFKLIRACNRSCTGRSNVKGRFMPSKKAVVLSLIFLISVCAFSSPYKPEGNTAARAATVVTHETQETHLSGFEKWVTRIYNGHRVLYAVIVTLVMAAMGITLAFLADIVLKALGLEVSRISHRE